MYVHTYTGASCNKIMKFLCTSTIFIRRPNRKKNQPVNPLIFSLNCKISIEGEKLEIKIEEKKKPFVFFGFNAYIHICIVNINDILYMHINAYVCINVHLHVHTFKWIVMKIMETKKKIYICMHAGAYVTIETNNCRKSLLTFWPLKPL